MRRVDRSVVMTATVVTGSYRPLPKPPKFVSRTANAAKTLTLRTPAKLYSRKPLLERLPQDLQDMAAALGPCIQEEHPVVGQRDLTQHGHVTPTDQSCIREGLVGRATREGGDPRCAVAGEASDAREAGGVHGFGQGHPGQDGGAATRQPRPARLRGAGRSTACLDHIADGYFRPRNHSGSTRVIQGMNAMIRSPARRTKR
jgi:hypothetical protein